MKIVSKSIEISGRTLTLEVGKFAEQASAAVLARYGDTMVISTVVASPKETTLNYFPLIVEYVERLYAGGRIKGSRWVKREGRPSDDAILKGRVIDRSIRPLFNQNFNHDIQIIVTVLSVDGENEPDILGIIATSAALSISPIPWHGPIGAIRVGYIPSQNGNNGFFTNPGVKEVDFSEMDLVISATKEKVVMIEAGMNEIPEEVVLKGMAFARDDINKIIALINDLTRDVGKEKIELSKLTVDSKLVKLLEKNYHEQIKKCVLIKTSKEQEDGELTLLTETVTAQYPEEYKRKDIETALNYLIKKKIRQQTLKTGKRVDDRDYDTIRPITCEVGLLPRTHGSCVFQRGQTQALTVATLGSPSLEQLIESPEGETAKRFIHHYSMPPYSVGETGRFGFPSRREVGHGALAERALLPVIPSQDVFPYTIRLVSEIMSSNGSTSMASTCGSTLALMDAGVPIKNPVAGISIGLIEEDNISALLTDIIGLEDFFGDMDFKIAGTKDGITVIQLDVKNDGLTAEIIKKSFAKAKIARLKILEAILSVLPVPRATLSRYAPRVVQMNVPVEKIGEVIGPGGKIIRQIITQTKCDININDEGKVTIAGTDPSQVELAQKWLLGIVKEIKPEEVYEGIVKRILPFGVFVEILPGREGMVHVSQLSKEFVSDPNKIVSIGQRVTVRVIEIDDQGRVNLSMLFGEDAVKRPYIKRPPQNGMKRFARSRRF